MEQRGFCIMQKGKVFGARKLTLSGWFINNIGIIIKVSFGGCKSNYVKLPVKMTR